MEAIIRAQSELQHLLGRAKPGPERSVILHTLGSFASYRNRATMAYFGSNRRPAPFNTILLGGPGSGKTILTAVCH